MALIKCVECGKEISSDAPSCPGCGNPVKTAPAKTKNFVSGKFVLVTFLALGGFIWWQVHGINNGAPVVTLPHDRNAEALAGLQLKDWKWKKGGFDAIMLLDATITNSGKIAAKDIEIECRHSGNSGTKIDSNSRVLYEAIPAGQSKKIRDFNMGMIHSQATATNCQLVSAVAM